MTSIILLIPVMQVVGPNLYPNMRPLIVLQTNYVPILCGKMRNDTIQTSKLQHPVMGTFTTTSTSPSLQGLRTMINDDISLTILQNQLHGGVKLGVECLPALPNLILMDMLKSIASSSGFSINIQLTTKTTLCQKRNM